MKGCKVRYGSDCPPRSTLRDWADRFALQGRTNPMGRPSTLTAEENAAVVVKYFDGTRAEGAKLNEDGILVMAQQVVRACRGSNALANLYFNESWARDFKRRQGWTWRTGNTDRRPSIVADTIVDNKWRKFVQNVFLHPALHGIPMSLGYSSVPPQLRLAFDETPLKYFAEQKGTYDHPKTQNVFISCSGEKRMVTGGPVTNELGKVVYFQIIWKGTPERCHPHFSDRMKALMHRAIHHDHAAKKTQAHETFTRLLKELDAELQAVKQSSSLPLDVPSIMLIGNVSSHINYEELKKVACHAHFDIYHVPRTHIYLLLGLPNRSHMLNSGDHLVNKMLRAHCRQKAKLRLLRHCMDICDGKIPAGTPLDMSKFTVKPLLCLWVSEWLQDPQLSSWVKSSWAKVLDTIPEVESVDDLPPPPAVIFLPPPPSVVVADNDEQGVAADPAVADENVIVQEARLPPQRRKRAHKPEQRAVLEERAKKRCKKGAASEFVAEPAPRPSSVAQANQDVSSSSSTSDSGSGSDSDSSSATSGGSDNNGESARGKGARQSGAKQPVAPYDCQGGWVC